MTRYKPNDPRDYLAALDFINYAREQDMEIVLDTYSPPRSGKQNRYLYFCLAYFAHCYNCTEAEAKEIYFKRFACPHIFRVDLKDKDGNDISYYRSTADLNTVEMSNVIRNFIDWAGCQGVEIPEPDDDKSVRYCEREIEKTQSYGT